MTGNKDINNEMAMPFAGTVRHVAMLSVAEKKQLKERIMEEIEKCNVEQ